MNNRALQGKEEALGPKHTSTLSTVNNLGNLYKNQGRLAEAEAMYNRALQGSEEALWTEAHIDTRYGQQPGLCSTPIKAGWPRRRPCTIGRCKVRRRHLDRSTHRHSIRSTTWACSTPTKAGWPKAEAMYNWALQGKEEALGPEHTSTLDTVNNIKMLDARDVTSTH